MSLTRDDLMRYGLVAELADLIVNEESSDDVGSSGVAGTLSIYPATANKGKLTITCTDQTGDTTVALVAGAMGQATTINMADPGASAAYLVMSTAQVTLAEANTLDGAVAGTQAASKVVLPDANVNIGTTKVTALHIGTSGSETQVTSTGAELNILDGCTATYAELNYLDLTTGPGTQEASKAVVADANVNTGVSKVTELHIGATGAETQVTSTGAELNILDGCTATYAELNYLDLTTGPGTQEASKAVVADANVNTGVSKVTELHIGATGAETQVTSTAAELNILDGCTATYAELNYLDLTTGPGTQEASKAVVADANVNTGVSKVTELHIGATGAETQVTSTATELNILDGCTATYAELNYLDLTTGPGTQEASKAVVADANVNTGVSKITELHIGASGSEVQVTATPAEINRLCDTSGNLVLVGGTTLAVTEALHDGKTIGLDHSAATSTCTLPDATGSGARFRFVVVNVNTNNHVIKVPDSNNVMTGSVNLLDNDSNAQTAYAASGTDDTLTLNGTTTGGQAGDWVEFIDIKADTWAVRGQLVCPTGSDVADPFSPTV